MKWFRLVLIPLAVSVLIPLTASGDYILSVPPAAQRTVGSSTLGPYKTWEAANAVNQQYFNGRGTITESGSSANASGGANSGAYDDSAERQQALEEQQRQEAQEAAERQQAIEEQQKRNQQAIAEQQRKDREEAARRQAEFNEAKQEALESMKGFHEDDGLGLKGVGSSNDLGLKGVGGSQTDNLGLKGMDDLKDAVADSSVKTLFEKKGASRDLLSAHAQGITALDRAASILQGAATNPALVTSLEQAKAEADGRFGTQGKDAGQFNTVVLGDALAPDNKPVPVPPNVAIRPTYQRVVIEREEIDKQVVAGEQNLKTIEADPSWMHNQALVRQHYDQANVLVSLRTMSKYDSNLIANMVNFPEANFDESIAQPPQEKHLDKGVVPSPSPRAGTP